MIRAEFRKLTAQRSLLVLIAVLLLLQCGRLYYQAVTPGEDGYSSSDVGEVYASLGSDQAAELEEQLTALEEGFSMDSVLADVETAEELEELLSSYLGQQAMLNALLSEVEDAAAYPDYLAHIASEAERLNGSGLLSRKGTFSARSSAVLAEAYAGLGSRSLTWIPSEGMALVTDNPLTDCCILLCVALLVLSLTTAEREGGQHLLIHASLSGSRRTWRAKLAAVCLCALALTALFYLPAVAIGAYFVGFGDPGAPVQSLPLYYSCPYPLTVGGFLMAFFLCKALGLLVASLCCFCVGCGVRDTLNGVLSLTALAAVSLLPWHLVNRTASYGVLKELNLTALALTHHYFETAQNGNLFGYPVPTEALGIGVGAVLCAAAVLLSRLLWARPTPVEGRLRLPRRKGRSSDRVLRRELGAHERKKLLVTNRAGLIAAVLLVVLVFLSSAPREYSIRQNYYRRYARILAGELTEEKRAYLDSEQASFDEAEVQLELLNEQLSEGLITDAECEAASKQYDISEEQKAACRQALAQYDYLEEQQAQGANVEFLDESGYDQLFGDWGDNVWSVNALWLALLLLLCLHNVWAMESATGMTALLRCAPGGLQRVGRQKRRSALLLTLLLAPVPYLRVFVLVRQSYALDGLDRLTLSASSVSALAGTPLWCTLWGYFLLRGLSALAEAALWALALLFLSRALKTRLGTLLSGVLLYGVVCFLAGATGCALPLAGRETVPGMLAVIACALLTLPAAHIYQVYQKKKEETKP